MEPESGWDCPIKIVGGQKGKCSQDKKFVLYPSSKTRIVFLKSEASSILEKREVANSGRKKRSLNIITAVQVRRYEDFL